jgi:hypothetical protein
VHNCLAETRSSCGVGAGPFLLLDSDREGLPWESRDVVEVFPSDCLSREMERESVDVRGDPEDGLRCIDGRISFFCLDQQGHRVRPERVDGYVTGSNLEVGVVAEQ